MNTTVFDNFIKLTKMNDLKEENFNNQLKNSILKAFAAFGMWSIMPVEERANYLNKLRNVISSNQDRIIEAISIDTKKPVTEIICQEITAALEMIRYIEKNYPVCLKDRKSHYRMNWLLRKTNIIRFEPIGIIAVIGPSNFPFSLIIMQSAASIMCGNCVVVKPSEKCPHVSVIIKELITEAGFPEGVIELITGGKRASCELISDVHVSKVIFTGSYQNGRDVAALCGKHFKQCILELGGSTIAVICRDANIIKAAKCIAWSTAYCNAGSCIGTRFVLADDDVFERFNIMLKKELCLIKAGNSFDPETDTNNSINVELIEHSDLDEKSTGSKPALIIKRIETIEQAIEVINNSEFGLSVSVWSKNLKSAFEISKRIKAGMVWINDCSTALPDFPWGGIKNSGWGRLYSKEAINELTNLKIISIDRSRSKKGKTWWYPYNKKKYNIFRAVNSLLGGKIKLALLKELIFRSRSKKLSD